MRAIILDAKYLITKIIIQIILLINDESLKQTVCWPKMKIQKSMEWKYAFFKDKEINTVISNILFKFVTRGNRIVHGDKNVYISSRLGRNIDTILMLLSDLRKDVFFTSSILLQDGALIQYYSNRSKQSGFINTGVQIKENLIFLIRDIYSNKFGTLKELIQGGSDQKKEKIKELNNATTYMFNWVTSFCPL